MTDDGSPVAPVRFSTDDLDDGCRSSRWMAWNRAALVDLACTTPDGRGLRGTEVTLPLPGVTVGHVRAAPHRVARDESTIAASPTGSAVLYAVLHGRTTLALPGGDHAVCAGDVVVVDADRPFARTLGPGFAELAVKLPRHAVDLPAGGVAHVGATTRARVAALARYLATPAGSPLPADVVARVARDLAADVTTGSGAGDRFALARLTIERRLHEPGLGAGSLAETLGVSLRQLSRLFAAAGTSVPAYVTHRRVTHAAATLLTRPELPVARVAARHGFASAAYFTRVFRDRFGVTPSAYRDGRA